MSSVSCVWVSMFDVCREKVCVISEEAMTDKEIKRLRDLLRELAEEARADDISLESTDRVGYCFARIYEWLDELQAEQEVADESP